MISGEEVTAGNNRSADNTDRLSLWKREKIYVLNWSGLGQSLQKIRDQVLFNSFRPTVVVGISRGGLVPATYFANAFDVEDLAIIGISRNISEGTYSAKHEPVLTWVSTDRNYDRQRVLLVDDVAGEGKTLYFAQKFLRDKGADYIQTAVIAKIQKSQFTPNYAAVELDDWIVFPWEKNVTDGSMNLETIRF